MIDNYGTEFESNTDNAKKIFNSIQTFLLICLWTPIFRIRNQTITTIISWIGMIISITYQLLHIGFNTCSFTELCTISGISNSTDNDPDLVKNDTIYDKVEFPASFLYYFARGTVYFMFWIERNDLRDIYTITTYSIRTDEFSIRKLSVAMSWMCKILFSTYGAVIILNLTLFYSIRHNFTWLYLITRIYSLILETSILMVYCSTIYGYQVAFELFFKSITAENDVDVAIIRAKLNVIGKIYEKIQRKLGFFVFWIFVMNYHEIVFIAVVVPRFDHFDLTNRDNFLWFLDILRCLVNITAIFIVVVKVDLQIWAVDELFRDFEHSMVKCSRRTDISVLVMEVKDTVDLRFTAWFDCIQIRRSVLISYLVNLIVYSNLFYGLVRWFIH